MFRNSSVHSVWTWLCCESLLLRLLYDDVTNCPVVGCTDEMHVSNGWAHRLNNDHLVIRCNWTHQEFHMTCVGNTWVGDVVNCTQRRKLSFTFLFPFLYNVNIPNVRSKLMVGGISVDTVHTMNNCYKPYYSYCMPYYATVIYNSDLARLFPGCRQANVLVYEKFRQQLLFLDIYHTTLSAFLYKLQTNVI